MRKRGRSILASTLLAAGCNQPAQPQPPPPVNAVTPASANVLWRDPVGADHYARRVLYTWTTTEQIDELRRDHSRLLTRTESPTHGASYYEQVVHHLATRGDAVAKLLDTTAFAKSRFAWPAPWATREGVAGEDYGSELIRVTLHSNAIVLALSTVTGAFDARDLDDAPVPIAEVIAHPERIGAVLFIVNRVNAREDLPDAGSSYREYVLCNEAMIATWSVGTRDIADELAAEISALDELANQLRFDHPTHDQYAAFIAARAFDHELDVDFVIKLVRDLRATPNHVAIEGRGNVAWPGLGPPRPPPRVVRKPQRGTFGMGGTY